MTDAVLLPRGWKGRRVEVFSNAGEQRTGEIVQALDSGLVLRGRTGIRLYPWTSIKYVKLLVEERAA